MIEMTEVNITQALELDFIDRKAEYIKNGRRLFEINLSTLEACLIEILTQVKEECTNKGDVAIASWIMIELEIRGQSQQTFLDELARCILNLPVNQYLWSINITDSVERLTPKIKS